MTLPTGHQRVGPAQGEIAVAVGVGVKRVCPAIFVMTALPSLVIAITRTELFLLVHEIPSRQIVIPAKMTATFGNTDSSI